MQINVVGNKVVSLNLKETKKKKESFNLNYEVHFLESGFYVLFDVILNSPDQRSIVIKYRTDFKTDVNIDDNFREQPYPYVNGPAIAYPFLRSYLATITLNSGMMPILLPSVNFLALWNQMQKEKSQSSER